jgi:hypothetical protein
MKGPIMTQRSFAHLVNILKGSAAAAAPEASQAAPLPVVTPAPAPAGDAGADAQPQGDFVTVADAVAAATEAKAEGHKAGFAAANARMGAVLGSDAGKANPAMAAFMLTNTEASAETIIGQLATMPAGAAAPAPAAPAAPAGDSPADRIQATTPVVDLGGAAAANNGDDGKTGSEGKPADIWGSYLGMDANGTVAQGGIVGHTYGAAPKGMEGIAHGC